jgi:hypothetical protein
LIAIETVVLWVNVQNLSANGFSLKIVDDNLKNQCIFYYALTSEYLQIADSNINETSQLLAQGNLLISGQEYIDWDLSTEANQWAYEWAALQLNLVLLP